MKPVILIIASLVFVLPNFSSLDNGKLLNIEDSNSIQNDHYQNQSLFLESAILNVITCESCHGDIDYEPVVIMDYLKSNFDASLVVHQENNPQYISGLEHFLETHDEDEAWDKHVDYQKVLDIVEGQ